MLSSQFQHFHTNRFQFFTFSAACYHHRTGTLPGVSCQHLFLLCSATLYSSFKIRLYNKYINRTACRAEMNQRIVCASLLFKNRTDALTVGTVAIVEIVEIVAIEAEAVDVASDGGIVVRVVDIVRSRTPIVTFFTGVVKK